ncbi:MAG: hypothetical protein KJ578_11395 [Bacteroidetes bacterium]|nr:hypothetical protein [Bacteroidota bacterium]MBU2558373.1 hypothetical protein [Bacteroidota bacterium]
MNPCTAIVYNQTNSNPIACGLQAPVNPAHNGPGDLFAIMVKQGTTETMYYVHKDYLGSISAITDATGYHVLPNKHDNNSWLLPPSKVGGGFSGPGSGNHWSDPYRTENSSWWLGNEASFDYKYGEGAYDSYYNQHIFKQTSEKTISNGDVSNNNELSTAWVQLGFFYYDSNGNPIAGKDGTFGQFWVYEASVIDEAQVTGRQLNSNGFKKNDALTYGLFGTSIWANIIYAGFDAAKKIQPTVATWIKGSRLFGRGSNVLSGVMISYDFATGTANTSTLVNAGVTMAGSAVIIFAGAAATPYVIGAGVIYGVISVAGGDEWLNSNFDISDQINFIKP